MSTTERTGRTAGSSRPRRVAAGRERANPEVGERAQHLFKMLVEHYLAAGDPVGSKTLASTTGIAVSPATVRNIMADLEARGLVSSPHTSAGRVPTHRGLRFFVDSLISVQPMDARSVGRIRGTLDPDMTPHQLVEAASRLLSRVTHMAGVVTVPRPAQLSLRQVEFLPLSDKRVLAILVVNDREVQNRVIHTDREYHDTELTQAANYINREFGGKSLLAIRTGVLDSMQHDKDRLDAIMQTALDMASKTFAESDEEAEYVVTGESNLVESLASVDAVRDLFEAFTRKGAIVHLLDRCLGTDGIQMFIGEESGYRPFDDYTLVTARYEVNGEVAGVLGVIGPTRMAYEKVIPVVDVTARLLGSAIDYDH
ncbi:MAG: heat-inducible transcription repressor HrcA [Gammaproteobacteria bacterium]|nr:heat-inducible transcription repressor HrcA [Gammaproteobacteria bacterium]